jgi:hypothetical protein
MTNLSAVMDGLAASLSGLVVNRYAWPVESITVPCVVVGYPSRLDFDMVFARGADTWLVPLWYVVGKTGTKDARDALSDILSEAGSVKALLDGAHTFGDVRVTNVEVTEVTIAAVVYLAAKFDCEVYG